MARTPECTTTTKPAGRAENKTLPVAQLNPREEATVLSASILLAGILASGIRMTAQDAALNRWACIQTARSLVDEVSPEAIDRAGLVADLPDLDIRQLADAAMDEALRRSGGNRKQAALLMGVKRTTFLGHLKKRKQRDAQ